MLSVIVPVYNEVLYIQKVVKRLLEQEIVAEIIIVDDGSTDGTKEVIQRLCSSHNSSVPNRIIKAHFHPRNLGKGAAIQSGLALATQKYTVVQDADLEYDPAELVNLLKPLQKDDADVVFGSRFLGPRRIFLFWHFLGNKFLTFCANLLYNTNMTDLMTCYKLMPTEIWRNLGLRSRGFEVEGEIAAKVFKSRLRVFEIPISYRGRGYEEGKKTNWSTGLRTLLTLLKYRFWTRNIGEETLYRIARMRRFNWFIYQQMQPFIGKRILEVGCGIGTFTPFFPQAEYYLGIDVQEKFIDKLRETYAEFLQFEFEVADLEKMNFTPLKSKNLDTILCINVLEHLEKDDAILEQFNQILQPDGKLILLVPAMPNLYSSLDKELGHYRRYKLSRLKKMIINSGFCVIHQQYFNTFGVLGWWLNGKLLRRRLLPNRQLNLYESLAPFFFRIERKLHLPFGLSIFFVAQKIKS